MEYSDVKIGLKVVVQEKYGSWLGEIVSLINNSKVKVNVKDIETEKGWDKGLKKHIGFKIFDKNGVQTGWSCGKNNDYGCVFERKINQLTLFKKENN